MSQLKKEPITESRRELVWRNIIFFAVTTIVGFVGGSIYVYKYGMAPSELAMFLFYVVITGMSITVGYHRLFAHTTYKTHPVIEAILLFFGAAAFEQSAYDWASQHRDHHQYVDTDKDPYSIKKGFWYAHIGWLMFWRHPTHHENVRDLAQNKLLRHQDRHYILWAVGSGILVPLVIGGLTGHFWGAFIMSVCLRVTLVYHFTFFINSVCHMFGNATYDIHASAKDYWLVALVTYGEGYHNFHHRFPVDYRNGVRWYHWDPSKWLIATLSFFGLATDLKKTSRFRIEAARLAGEEQRTLEQLAKQLKSHLQLQATLQKLKDQHRVLKGKLSAWEMAACEYRDLFRANVSKSSHNLMDAASEKVKAARSQFKEARSQWQELISKRPPVLQECLLNV